MISANLVVKNEEEYLEQVLIQVLKLADEILICDTGSTDGTLEIIKKFPEVNLIQGIDKVCDARNELLKKSKGDLIWIVDGDEVWPDEALINLRKLPEQYPDKRAFEFSFRHFMSYGESLSHNSKCTRLFRNNMNVRWERIFPNEMLMDDLGIISSTNKNRKDILFVKNIKFSHYGGIKKNQWREEQPRKFGS